MYSSSFIFKINAVHRFVIEYEQYDDKYDHTHLKDGQWFVLAMAFIARNTNDTLSCFTFCTN